MARIRTIKPEFWKDEELSELPELTHMFAAALLNYSDDEGYFNANPALIKAELFPLREPSRDIHGMLIELSNIGYLKLFNGPKGKTFGHVVNFQKHQRVNRPTPSKIKELIEFSEDSVINHGALIAGKERNREQGTGNKEQGMDIAADEYAAKQPKKPKKPKSQSVTHDEMRATFPDLTDQTIDDWITARKDKGAKTLTKTAWDIAVDEIIKSRLSGEQALKIAAARGWQGIKAEWLLNHISGGINGNQTTFGQHSGKGSNGSSGSAFDKVMREINAARQRDGREPMGHDGSTVRPQVGEQLWGDSGPSGGLGSIIEGDYTRDD